MYYLIGFLIVALVATNIAWLIFLSKFVDKNNIKETNLLDRINILANKPPMFGISSKKLDPNVKADNEKRPRSIEDALFDPEMEAVGKIDPSFIDRARSAKK